MKPLAPVITARPIRTGGSIRRAEPGGASVSSARMPWPFVVGALVVVGAADIQPITTVPLDVDRHPLGQTLEHQLVEAVGCAHRDLVYDLPAHGVDAHADNVFEFRLLLEAGQAATSVHMQHPEINLLPTAGSNAWCSSE